MSTVSLTGDVHRDKQAQYCDGEENRLRGLPERRGQTRQKLLQQGRQGHRSAGPGPGGADHVRPAGVVYGQARQVQANGSVTEGAYPVLVIVVRQPQRRKEHEICAENAAQQIEYR